MHYIAIPNKNHRIVSGARTTGPLHLGNYHGALKNWIKLQHQSQCFFFAADWHALTTDYEHPENIPRNTHEMILDWLGAGLDPNIATLFIQSHVPEHAELHVLLSMITPLSWLERVPTYKEQRQKLKEKNLATYGFLGYPTLQSADILLYQADFVPVGEDQVAHIELTREIARHFNHLYCKAVAIGATGAAAAETAEIAETAETGENPRFFKEPEALLTQTSKMPGLDGQKMSKSYHNTIELREAPASIEKKIKTMPTDPARVRRVDPGEPEKCPVWRFHQTYSSAEVQEWVQIGCRTAGIGCIECKQPVIEAVLNETKPIREKAEEYEKQPKKVEKILKDGAMVARETATDTLKEVRHMMGLKVYR